MHPEAAARSGSDGPERPARSGAALFWALGALLALCVILGGGGTPNPVTEVPLLFVSLIAAAVIVWLPGAGGPARMGDRAFWIVAFGIAAVPLLQLVPLPPLIWRNLPGRDVATQVLDIAGYGRAWRPVSLVPQMTLTVLLSLIPAYAMAHGVARLDQRGRTRILLAIAVLATVSAVVGILQFIAANDTLKMYAKLPSRFATGFFANRNTLPDLLAIGGLALLAWLRSTATGRISLRVAVGAGVVLAVLAFGTLATGSRTGILLFGAVVIEAGLTAMALSPAHLRKRSALAAIFIGLAMICGMWLATTTGAMSDVGQRFSTIQTERASIWQNTLATIPGYWPFGSGMGTFVPVYQAMEPLDQLIAAVTNRAHNEYLEIALEAGLFGLVMLLIFGVFVVVRAAKGLAQGGLPRIEARFALYSWIILALHSVVDYPLRNLAMLAVAGALYGFLRMNRVAGGDMCHE